VKLRGVEVVEEYQAPLGDVFDVASPRVGERLHRARVDKGLELADIARDTRVPLRHLAAIEGDNHESLPALTYSIGFVRTFAQAVGLPSDEIAAQFKAETTKSAHVPQTMPLEPLDESRLPPRGVVAVSAVGVVAIVAAIWAWGAGVFESAPPPPPAATAAVAAPTDPEPVMAADEQPLVSGDAPAATGDVGVPPAMVPAPTAAAPLPADAVAGAPVVLTATEEVWIKVYDAAQSTVKMGILQPGESYTVPADRGDLQLWTGRAGALRVTVGGRAIAPLGGPQETVQGVSLAPGALLARGG
jgi:cytoskeleton protein RodZ